MILLLLVGWSMISSAQQAPLYSQYMLNGFLLNPAVAGSEGYSAVNLTAREQWLGFPGGPATYALSFQSRIQRRNQISRSSSVRRRGSYNSKNGNVGLGGYIFSHRNGAVERLGIKATYAYHIKLDDSQLSFGLSLVGYQYKLNEDMIILDEAGDNLWLGAHKSVFIPDADAGVYFTTRELWAGFSVDQMFESVLKFGDAGYDKFVMERQYYLMAGYDFRVSRDVILTPSALLKYSESGRMQAEISGKYYFQQSYFAGVTYRTGQALVIMAGVSVDRFIFGYAYDMGLNSLTKHSYGTHEFTFVVRLGKLSRKFSWMNRF